MSPAAEATPLEQYVEALAAFQAEMPHVGKDQTATVRSDKGNYSYDYADLTTITETLLPLLVEHGLAWSAVPDVTEHGFVLRFRLAHRAGHAEGGCYPLPDPARATPQAIGSAITYARRYALCAITGLAPGGDDDDGAKASAASRIGKPQARTEPTVPSDDPAVARSELAAMCKERGWSTDEVGATFTGWDSEHRQLPQADAAAVREFTGRLRTGEVVPEVAP